MHCAPPPVRPVAQTCEAKRGKRCGEGSPRRLQAHGLQNPHWPICRDDGGCDCLTRRGAAPAASDPKVSETARHEARPDRGRDLPRRRGLPGRRYAAIPGGLSSPSAIRLRRQGWEEPLALLDEFRDANRRYPPDQRVLDLAVFVGQYVPLRDDALPGDFEVGLSETE